MATRTTTSAPAIYFIAKPQTFRISVKGLKPSTVHYFYFTGQRVDSSKLKPLSGKIGDTLITNTNGELTFDFFYDSGLTSSSASSLEEAQQQAARLAGTKEVVVTTLATTALSSDYEETSSSYWRSHILIQVYIPSSTEYTVING